MQIVWVDFKKTILSLFESSSMGDYIVDTFILSSL